MNKKNRRTNEGRSSHLESGKRSTREKGAQEVGVPSIDKWMKDYEKARSRREKKGVGLVESKPPKTEQTWGVPSGKRKGNTTSRLRRTAGDNLSNHRKESGNERTSRLTVKRKWRGREQ